MTLKECTSFQFSSPFPSYLSYCKWGEPWMQNAMEKLELGAWKNSGYRMRATEYSTGTCSIKIWKSEWKQTR